MNSLSDSTSRSISPAASVNLYSPSACQGPSDATDASGTDKPQPASPQDVVKPSLETSRFDLAEALGVEVGSTATTAGSHLNAIDTSPEQQLLTAQGHYRQLLEGSEDGMIIAEATTGRITEINGRLLEWIGHIRERVLGKRLWEIGAFAGIVSDARTFEQIQAKPAIHQCDLVIEGRGDMKWISRTYVVQGQRFLQVNLRDLAEEKQPDERWRLLARAAQHSRDSIIITDAELDQPGPRIVYANSAFSAISGYTAEEVVGKTPRILQGPKTDRALLTRLRATLLRGGIFQGEGTNYRKDGTEFQIDWQIVPLRGTDGAITHYVGFQRDVTARKCAERTLAQSEERYRLLVERSPDAMFVHSEGTILFANAATAKLLGAENPERLVGLTLAELLPSEVKTDQQQWMAGHAGTVTPSFEQNFRRLDGALVRVEGLAIPIPFGDRPAVQLILHDLTERFQMEEQIRQAQRLESLGMLAAGIAHDLNNVLAPILMAAPLLHETAATAMERRLLTDIEKSAVRGAGLVRQILGFAHGVGGEPQALQLTHLIEDVAGILSRTFPKNITIDLRLAKDAWPVEANPTQIHQVLLNLCVNARDAMPQGGELRLRLENCVMDELAADAFPGARPGRWVVVHVEDTGTGIPPEVLARMWEPFFTTKSADRGTGLGLSTVRGIVEDHAGFILVQTAPGRGTTFRAYLPLAKGAINVDTVVLSIPRGQGELILVADDEPSIRALASTVLTRYGYRVLLAVDGTDALAQFTRTEGISMVITDIDMPNLNGSALAGIVRRLNPAVKLLAMSGIDAAMADPFRPGKFADGFLVKPFTAGEILSLAHNLLHPAAP